MTTGWYESTVRLSCLVDGQRIVDWRQNIEGKGRVSFPWMTHLMNTQQLICGKQALMMTTGEHCAKYVELNNHCVDEDKIEFQWNNENNTQFRLNNTFRNCSIKENQLWWFVIFIEHVFETRENCLGPLLLVQVSFKGTLLCRGWGPPSSIYRRSIVCVLSSFYLRFLWKGDLSFWSNQMKLNYS